MEEGREGSDLGGTARRWESNGQLSQELKQGPNCKASPCTCKDGHLSQSHPVRGFAKDNLPCVYVVALTVVEILFQFPDKSLIHLIHL